MKFLVLVLVFAAAAGVTFIAARWGEARMDHAIVALIFNGELAVAMAILLASVFVVRAWRKRRGHQVGKAWTARVCGVIFVLQVGLALSLPLGGFLRERDEAEVRAWFEELAPKLEGYRDQHGSYPSELGAVVAPNQAVPSLFTRGDASYRSSESEFVLSVLRRGRSYRYGSALRSGRAGWTEVEEDPFTLDSASSSRITPRSVDCTKSPFRRSVVFERVLGVVRGCRAERFRRSRSCANSLVELSAPHATIQLAYRVRRFA